MKQLGARPQDVKHMKPKLMPSHKIVWLFFMLWKTLDLKYSDLPIYTFFDKITGQADHEKCCY